MKVFETLAKPHLFVMVFSVTVFLLLFSVEVAKAVPKVYDDKCSPFGPTPFAIVCAYKDDSGKGETSCEATCAVTAPLMVVHGKKKRCCPKFKRPVCFTEYDNEAKRVTWAGCENMNEPRGKMLEKRKKDFGYVSMVVKLSFRLCRTVSGFSRVCNVAQFSICK